jgi:hypothetical protein
MTDTPAPAKKRPDFIAYIPQPSRQTDQPPRLIRAGIAFTYRNGSIGVLYDLIQLGGQVLLVGIDDAPPTAVSLTPPVTAPQFEVSHVRDVAGKDSFWQTVGDAYRQDGYLAVFAAAWPRDGKVVLTAPRPATN